MPVPKDRPYIIAETAFHHEGDNDALDTLINEIIDLKVDAIKFHLLLDLDDYVVPDHPVAEPLKNWLFSEQDWITRIRKCSDSGMDVVALCNDVASIELIRSKALPVRIIEIHATGINDIFLLEAAARTTQTVMLGIGGSTEEEIAFAVNILEENGKSDVILMHGFQNYPTDHALLDLGRIQRYADRFGKQMGFTDHTDPADPENEMVSVLGLLLGANVLEKHFTPWPGEDRIDHQAAISKSQFERVKFLANLVWNAKGTGVDILSEAEKKYGQTGPMKKAIVARKDLPEGHKIQQADIAFKRTEQVAQFSQKEVTNIVGSTTLRAIPMNTIISAQDLSNSASS